MSNTPITINNKLIDTQLGDLLQLKTAKYEKGVTELKITKDDIKTVYKIGNTNSTPPIMVAIEVVKENTKEAHLFDETTGKKLKSPIKVLCQWFSQNTNKFHERWLSLDVLEIIDTKNEKVDFEIGNVVSLKSIDYSEEFIKTLKAGIFPNISKDDVKDKPELAKIKTIDYEITRIFKDASYSPPKMLVTAINEILEKDKKPLYNKATGKRNRYAANIRIKCMWYDHKEGKYSEHIFVKEALTLLENKSPDELIENKILEVFKDINL
jgi:uncharacterized protein YodC (DUF2158 family)